MKSSTRTHLIETLARDDLAAARNIASRHDARDLDALAGDIAQATVRNQLVLHYQPILDLRTGACHRVEALLRWEHPRYGLILPGELLPLADRTGQLRAFGRWVITEALTQAAAWRANGLRLCVAINLSSVELGSPSIGAALLEGIRSHGPDTVSVEIDAAVMAAGEVSSATMLQILSAGARISLDDVSAETLALSRIGQRADEIKLSRRLVSRATTDANAAEELRSLVLAARELHLEVVAVGVEDQATRDLVAKLGCQYAQGYWISRPLVPHRVGPIRRWFAGAALTGALALGAEVGSLSAGGLGLTVACAPVEVADSIAPGPCAIGFGARDRSSLAAPSVDSLRERTGLGFVTGSTTRTVLFIDARVDRTTQQALIDAVTRDVADLEQRYEHRFATVPTVYVFATRSSFALGLEQLFGARGPDAGMLAVGSGGVALPRQNAIVVNLQNTDPTQVTIVRHELTHILVHQIAGTNAVLPVWFDEGLATLEAETITDNDGGAHDRVVAARILDAGRAGLADLRQAELWAQRNAALDGQAYAVAAEAVRLLQARVSSPGLVRMLEATGRGVPFADGFAFETGESISRYESAFPARLKVVTEAPRIAVSPSQGNITWTLSGLAPHTTVEVRITGSRYELDYRAQTDGYGMYRAAFGSTVAPGDYTIDATGSGGGAAHQSVRVGAG